MFSVSIDDPFYRITDHATDQGESLTNEEIDEILYGVRISPIPPDGAHLNPRI